MVVCHVAQEARECANTSGLRKQSFVATTAQNGIVIILRL